MSIVVRDKYLREIHNCIDHIKAFDPNGVDMITRYTALARLIGVFDKLISMPPPLKDDMIQLIEDIKEKIDAIFTKELECNHHYCSKLQDLRQDLRTKAQPNLARFRQLEWRRQQELAKEEKRLAEERAERDERDRILCARMNRL
jgi:CO dehydrogenase/acetyl-CoA synthase beta subunit